MRYIILFIFSIIPVLVLGQNARIYGTIFDENGDPIEAASISVPYTSMGVISNSHGFFEMEIPANKSVNVNVSFVGYVSVDSTIFVNSNEQKEINFHMKVNVEEIQEVWISSSVNRGTNLTRIEIKDFNVLPSASGNIEALLKTMPGVASNNELSSQYSVRGGNFDENLVYVNGIEIYRPFLIRSAQQEGLSFVNPVLVRSIDFSAGGFEAKYGDKMSSVLDIKYRVPSKPAGSVSMSLLGGSSHIEGLAFSGKLKHLSGFRYKSTDYLLGTLDTKGNYKPRFYDFQTNIIYSLNKKIELSFLGNISSNIYLIEPENRETKFGTFNQALNLLVYYEGKEIDEFKTYTGAFTTKYTPNEHNTFRFILSSFSTFEKESFDILGYYSINQLDNRVGSTSFGDSLFNIGAAGFHDHARNNLEAHVYAINLTGLHEISDHTFEWGLKVQYEDIMDELNEWDILDSSGYYVPYNGQAITPNHYSASENHIKNMRYNAYFQHTKRFVYSGGKWFITYGIRASYWEFNKQILLSPRFSMAYIPNWNKNISLYSSVGFYYQPPFYKEFRRNDGSLNYNIIAQKSVHYILGTDFVFSSWSRPFKLTTEVYYKNLSNLIPYKIDNVRIKYEGENIAHGYATGIEFKLSGEFVKNAQSWASLSFLSTKEDIIGDYYMDHLKKVYPGYISRPTDQKMNFALFFQDYLPNNPEYKFHLTFFYGSRLPFSNPYSSRYDELFKMRAYKRIDFGLSKSIKKVSATSFIKSAWLNLEVLNLFGFVNVASYDWIRTISTMNMGSGEYAVPNYLTGRRLNAKLSFNF